MSSEFLQSQPYQQNTSWDEFSLQELKHMRSGVMSTLADYVTTFGQSMLRIYGERVHKIAIDADFTCPNRDGSKGHGGCSFCNNASFSPNGIKPATIPSQIKAGKSVIRKRTRAQRYIAYFQAYTNTYANIDKLRAAYDQALAQSDVIGLSVGTRPDCISHPAIELLASYQTAGFDIWLELGLQSSFDDTLARVNRGHGFTEYSKAVETAHKYGLKVCTHLMLGLPGEDKSHAYTTLQRVLDQDVEGLKIHPLHVVKGTRLANQWQRGEYTPLEFTEYIDTVCDLIEMTPVEVIYHRLTGTASSDKLLAPAWCGKKWQVLNAIKSELRQRNTCQGVHKKSDRLCQH
jgi:radical SAM protein (TIGR01212 family)